VLWSLGGSISSFRQGYHITGNWHWCCFTLPYWGMSIGVYGIMIGGWASNNKFSLIGCTCFSNDLVRSSHGLSLIALLMMTGTLSLREISAQQSGMNWNVFYQPLSFLIFLICAFAESNSFWFSRMRNRINGGYHTEYSSMKMGFYLFAEYANMFISSILAVLFFGGYTTLEWVGQ
jgi:NADH-quinone oxidoreductase subunit H